MSKDEHPLSPLAVPDYDDSAVRIEKWESARVEYAIKRLKLGRHALRELQAVAPSGRISFDDFNNRFPTFPMLLSASSLPGETPMHRNPKGIHPMWFKSFKGLPFISFYEEELERYKAEVFGNDESRVLGMVFPRKGFAHGLVVHNGDWQTYLPQNSGCHLYQGGKVKSMTLVVQPFSGLLDHVLGGLHWEPANP
jgi:hypothetical protein|tara:strand:- start:11909 stop:12493 length:585 start_codon:yes stop_codon:yes gene_type:complete